MVQRVWPELLGFLQELWFNEIWLPAQELSGNRTAKEQTLPLGTIFAMPLIPTTMVGEILLSPQQTQLSRLV
jgi:hypothetical protein